MRFARFGIVLERLEHSHLELVRQWRNSDWVRPYMRYQTIIRAADQVRWFAGLNPRHNWFFVARVEDVPFALFHVKGIDWILECGESGGFVGDPGFIGSPESAQATLALMDFAFLVLHLRSLDAQYSAALLKIVRFNQQLGYQIFREETDGFVRARVTAERYFECTHAFHKAAAALHGTAASLVAPDPWLARRLELDGASLLADFRLQLR